MLLPDGLGKIVDPALRLEVAEAVAGLAESGAWLALTCRTRAFTGAVAEAFAAWGAPVTLAPFSLGQIRHPVRSWQGHLVEQGAIERDHANWYAKLLISALMQSPELRDLGRNPLLLTCIAALYFNAGEYPADRIDLYENLVHLLLFDWRRRRRATDAALGLLDEVSPDGRLPGFTGDHLRHTLEDLACRAHLGPPAPDGLGRLNRSQALGAFASLRARFTPDADLAMAKAERVLRHLEHG